MRLHFVVFTGIRDQSAIFWLDVYLRGGLVGSGPVTAADHRHGPGRGFAGHPHGIFRAAGNVAAATVGGKWVLGIGNR